MFFMRGSPLYHFTSGMIMVLALAISLFFLKFWRKSNERLFLYFALAFLLFSVERVLIMVFAGAESVAEVYIFRMVAFLLIIYAVIEKNRKGKTGLH